MRRVLAPFVERGALGGAHPRVGPPRATMPTLGKGLPDIVVSATNVHQPGRLSLMEVISRVNEWNLSSILLLGLGLNLAFISIFAGLYFALGEGCYSLYDEVLTFEEMFALSAHTFTTVGFGSVFPTCVGGQVLVIWQSYSSLIMQLILVLINCFVDELLVLTILNSSPSRY